MGHFRSYVCQIFTSLLIVADKFMESQLPESAPSVLEGLLDFFRRILHGNDVQLADFDGFLLEGNFHGNFQNLFGLFKYTVESPVSHGNAPGEMERLGNLVITKGVALEVGFLRMGSNSL